MGQGRSLKLNIPWSDLSIASLEADIAYFDARIALLDRQPNSYYQKAQLRAYRELEVVLGEQLQRLRQARVSSTRK